MLDCFCVCRCKRFRFIMTNKTTNIHSDAFSQDENNEWNKSHFLNSLFCQQMYFQDQLWHSGKPGEKKTVCCQPESPHTHIQTVRERLNRLRFAGRGRLHSFFILLRIQFFTIMIDLVVPWKLSICNDFLIRKGNELQDLFSSINTNTLESRQRVYSSMFVLVWCWTPVVMRSGVVVFK